VHKAAKNSGAGYTNRHQVPREPVPVGDPPPVAPVTTQDCWSCGRYGCSV